MVSESTQKEGRKKLEIIVFEAELECPVCGRKYVSYREYFDCWTSHLEQKFMGEVFIPRNHDDYIKLYSAHPDLIEPGLRVIGRELGFFRSRIDILAVDKDRNICIIDVDLGKDKERKIKQLRLYRKSILDVGLKVYGIRFPRKVRLLMVRPRGRQLVEEVA